MQKLIFILTILYGINITAQTLDFELTVKNLKGGVDANRTVVFVESSTFERLEFKTDASGKLSITFDHGDLWLGSVGEMRNCLRIKTTFGGTSERRITYDPEGWERENQVLPDRRSINFTEVTQGSFTRSSDFSDSEALVTIILQGRSGERHSNIHTSLVCFATSTKYTGKTNSKGEITFKVPNNNSYEIDIDGVESLRFIDLDNRPTIQTVGMLFQPRTFTEKKDDRFIVQKLPDNVEPSSSHARIKLAVHSSGSTSVDEEVHVRMLKSNKVYKAKTNAQGEAIFMLPINNKFFIDFEYQRGADLIDLTHIKGIAYKDMSVNYIVDPKLKNIEDFIPSVSELITYDINDFVDAQYPEPEKGDVDFYLEWGNKFNENSKEAILEVGLKVKSKMTRKTTEPLNICFVIDKSGSMHGEDRIEQLKTSLIEFVRQLESTDMVSIVVFESDATVAVPAQEVGDKKRIIDIIHAIQAGGGTNIHSGLMSGFEQLKTMSNKTSINRLVLLTNGYGSTPIETIVSDTKSFIKQGFELSAVGVGTDYNQALLSQLASAGGGLLHLAGTAENIKEVFQHELESILYPMAKKATLTVRYNDEIVYRQLYGYANEVVTTGKMTVDIANLFPGLDQLALIKFDLIHSTPEIVKEKVEVTLEYTDAVTGKPIKLEKSIHPEWTDATGELDLSIDKEHKKVMAIAIANQSLKVMANAFETGEKSKAEAAVIGAIKQIETLFPNATPEQLLYVVDRLQQYVDAFEKMKENKFHSGN